MKFKSRWKIITKNTFEKVFCKISILRCKLRGMGKEVYKDKIVSWLAYLYNENSSSGKYGYYIKIGPNKVFVFELLMTLLTSVGIISQLICNIIFDCELCFTTCITLSKYKLNRAFFRNGHKHTHQDKHTIQWVMYDVHIGQVTKLWLSCYLVLLWIDSKTR